MMAAAPDTLNLSLLARQYVAAGWALVPIPSGSKGPRGDGWNQREHCVTTAEGCRRIQANVGLAHAYSGTCVIDLDDFTVAREWLGARGVDVDTLWNSLDAVKISSGRPNRGKLLYRLPPGVAPLRSKKLAGGALELRCAAGNNTTVQDVLPPSVHPDTGEPYVWEYDDLLGTHWSNPPVLPDEVLQLWQKQLGPVERDSALEYERLPRPEKEPMGLGREELRKLVAQEDPSCDYDTWLGVGFALHHEMRGARLGLEIWDEWSQEGNNYPGYELLESKWASFGKGYSGPEKTIRGLMTAHGIGSIDDFEDLGPVEEQVAERAVKFAVRSAGEFADGPPQEWIIKGILPKAQLGMIYGESTAGKSFVAMDMLAAIARGEKWRGLRTKALRTVMIIAEGAGGAKNRVKAYEQHYGVHLSDYPFGIIQDRPDLFGQSDYKRIIKQIKEWGGADVIAVDTLAQSSAGANENSGEDMGKVLEHCHRLHIETGAMVLLVHHAGKDASRGARGWSGLKAAMDVEIEVARHPLTGRTIRMSKSKDGDDGAAMGFKLNIVTIGTDEDGDPITSCVVEHTAAPVNSVDSKDGLKVEHHIVLKVISDAAELDPEPMHHEDIRRAAVQLMEQRGKTDNRPRDAKNAIAKLESLGYLQKDADGRYSIKTKN